MLQRIIGQTNKTIKSYVPDNDVLNDGFDILATPYSTGFNTDVYVQKSLVSVTFVRHNADLTFTNDGKPHPVTPRSLFHYIASQHPLTNPTR